MFDYLMNKRFFMVLPVAAALVLTACKEDEAVAAAPEPVDLTQTEDLFAQPVQPNPLTSDPTAVVVRVNGQDITRGEILELVNTAMQQLGGRVQPQQIPQIQGQMYERFKNDLITKKLMDAAVAEANVEVTTAEVNETLEKIKTSIPEGMTLESALAAQGMTLDKLTESIRTDMATRKFMDEKTANVPEATEAEAKEFYDSHPDDFKQPESISASHILMKFEETDTDESKAEKKARLEKIRADILAGTITFEDAAKEHSGCPSGAQGGSLGTFGKGQMVPEFEVAAFTQEIDEVGDVVETQFGYHIIKTTEKSEAGEVAFEEAEPKIVSYLTNQKKQEVVGEYLKSLRDSATIEEISM